MCCQNKFLSTNLLVFLDLRHFCKQPAMERNFIPTVSGTRRQIAPALGYIRHPTTGCLKTEHPKHTAEEKAITVHSVQAFFSSPMTLKRTRSTERGRRGISFCTVAVHKRITDRAERFTHHPSMWCYFRRNYLPQLFHTRW